MILASTPHSSDDSRVNDHREPVLLYIGNNAIHICAKMVGYGYTGLTFNTLRKTGEWLKHRAMMGQQLPDAIVCDDYFGLQGIQKFMENLRSDNHLHRIPVILLAKNLDAAARKMAVLAKVDDIYDYHLNPADLGFRIDSLNKIKQLDGVISASPEAVAPPQKPKQSLGHMAQVLAKRAMDIAAALFGLIILSPLWVVVAILIKLDSKGPVFYISKRVGRNYKIFNFYKFRTMRVNADQMLKEVAHLNQYSSSAPADGKGPVFVKIDNDPRVTKLGRFLRNTSIDELPQLFNILIGDMSLVGNRPLPMYEAKSLTKDGWAMRFMAPAGLTGLWQVSKRGKGDMTMEDRMALDMEYAYSNTFFGDIKLLMRTPMAMKQSANV